jgi:hypothetical protein
VILTPAATQRIYYLELVAEDVPVKDLSNGEVMWVATDITTYYF